MITLVTGATGHIGTNLVRALCGRKRRVRVLIHCRDWPMADLDVEPVQGDICDRASLERAFLGVGSVFHLAGRISIVREKWAVLEKTNVTGTRNIVQACLDSGVRRLVHFSSIHALLPTSPDMPVDESCPLAKGPNCPAYDRSKARGEEEVRRGIEEGLEAVIIIPTAVIGPFDFQPSYLGAALLAMAQGKLPALIRGGFDWVDVRDVVEGAIQAETLGLPGARYLLSGHRASVREIADLVADITGIPAPKMVFPMWMAQAGAPLVEKITQLAKKRSLFTSESVRALRGGHNISHEKATRELDYRPRPLRDTIADTLVWFGEAARKGRVAADPE